MYFVMLSPHSKKMKPKVMMIRKISLSYRTDRAVSVMVSEVSLFIIETLQGCKTLIFK